MYSCRRTLVILIFIQFTFIDCKFYSANIARERLLTDLFANYEASARPAPKGIRIDLHVNIVLQHFDFRESDGAFHFVGHLEVTWKDPKLKWKPLEYGNLTRVPVSQKIVWVPDLEVYNNAPDKMLRMHRNGIVIMAFDGSLLWSDTMEATIFCTTNMYNWPRDTHNCKLSLGSWTYDALDVDITNRNPNATMNFNNIELHNTEFKITNFTAMHVSTTYSCCAEPYSTVDYYIDFERRAGYIIIFRVVSICIVLLPIIAMALETHRKEKILLNGIALIVVIVHMLYFAKQIGRFSRGTPFIVEFYVHALKLITFASLLAVFSLMATHSKIKGNLPPRLSRFLDSDLIKLLSRDWTCYNDGYHQHQAISSGGLEEVKLHDCNKLINETSSVSSDWQRLAISIERLSLFILVPLYLILTSSYII